MTQASTSPEPSEREKKMLSQLRYKSLLSYLPGMASVVNSFASNEVQQQVYESLYAALNAKLESEGLSGPAPETRTPSRTVSSTSSINMGGPRPGLVAGPAAMAAPLGRELEHDLIDGESIHAPPPRGAL